MLEIDLEKYPEIRQALENRCRVIVEDIASDPVMEGVRGKLKSLDVNSILVIPITFADELLGALCIKTARAKEGFSQAEIQFSTAVARASANALKNAMLHGKLEESVASHRTVAEKFERILEQSPDLIFTTNEHDLIDEFNSGAEKILTFSPPGASSARQPRRI